NDPAGFHTDSGGGEMFVIALATGAFPGHRDVGLALLRDLPPFQVGRVVDFVHGRKTDRKVRETVAAGVANAEPVVKTVVEEYGLFKNVPRSLRTEVVR